MERIVLTEKFSGIPELWSPRIVAELNGQHVKLARIQGEFVWHSHEQEDELFLVLEGELVMQFRDREIALSPGEMIVVPRGVEHRPIAPLETKILLFEPAGTRNTGNVVNERTISSPDWI